MKGDTIYILMERCIIDYKRKSCGIPHVFSSIKSARSKMRELYHINYSSFTEMGIEIIGTIQENNCQIYSPDGGERYRYMYDATIYERLIE